MNNSLEDKYRSVIEDNVNVSKSNVGAEFLILLAGIFGICMLIYFFADNIANIYIDRMSNETQIKIEKVLALTRPEGISTNQNDADLQKLNQIKQKIISLDENLQNKSNFNIYIIKDKDINAFIAPDGSIYITTELLKQDFANEETLTFIMAHEMGHYAHRDTLKAISSALISAALQSVISSGQGSQISSVMSNFTYLSSLTYSKRQEKAADIYAGKVLLKLYGKTDGGINFFDALAKKERVPEFLNYFSTHPSTKNRMEILKNLK